jgi:hypothetical protein
LQNNAEQVRTSQNNTEQGASTTLKPRKIVCTFASIKKINVKPSEGKLTGRVLLEMKKRFFPQTLADTHKKIFLTMAVNLVYIKGGRKMMRPVLTKEEYMSLRDSEENRRADKWHMVQMNYSLVCSDSPEEERAGGDFPLKGCKTQSSTVGMDVDFNPDEADYEKKMADVPNRILEKKDELGLLMLERSATKGFHIVFRRHPELSQEENLRWASELLGVEYDKGAKDITRVFFTPTTENIIFIDEEIFERKETPQPPKGEHVDIHETVREESTASYEQKSVSEELPLGGQGGIAKESNLRAFDLCVENAGLKVGEMDVWGEHNWHSNLMAVLSVGLPKLMSKDQLLAVVREKLPNYSQTEDCKKLIAYFYDNYVADKGFMSTTLREINAKAQMPTSVSHKEEEEDEAAIKELTEAWTPPVVPKKIPGLMELLVSNYDPRFRNMLLLSALPVLSAHASHFRAKYINGKVIGPQQYVSVIGGSGQGKGTCTSLYQEMVQYTLQDNDNREWQKVKENAELRDKMANAKERPPKYHPKLRLFETTSKSSILELQTNLGKNGMLLGMFSEVDGLSSASRAAYSDISVLLRKGWDMDMHRQFYMSDSTCNTYTQMSISLLMAGTVKAMLERMFSDTNCEGGLMQRCIPVLVPMTKRTFRPPCQDFLSDEQKQERDSLLIELYQKDLALGDETQLLETPMMNRAIGQWFDKLEERYNDGQLTDAEADLSHRCGEFMLRAAIPLVALYGHETKEIVDFCRWVGETAHYAMCRIFGHRVQKDITSANEMLAARLDARKTAEPLLDKMPTVFTIRQFKEQRVKDGQSPEVKMLLSRYCRNGKIARIGRGVYRKGGIGNIVTVTEIGECTTARNNATEM